MRQGRGRPQGGAPNSAGQPWSSDWHAGAPPHTAPPAFSFAHSPPSITQATLTSALDGLLAGGRLEGDLVERFHGAGRGRAGGGGAAGQAGAGGGGDAQGEGHGVVWEVGGSVWGGREGAKGKQKCVTVKTRTARPPSLGQTPPTQSAITQTHYSHTHTHTHSQPSRLRHAGRRRDAGGRRGRSKCSRQPRATRARRAPQRWPVGQRVLGARQQGFPRPPTVGVDDEGAPRRRSAAGGGGGGGQRWPDAGNGCIPLG